MTYIYYQHFQQQIYFEIYKIKHSFHKMSVRFQFKTRTVASPEDINVLELRIGLIIHNYIANKESIIFKYWCIISLKKNSGGLCISITVIIGLPSAVVVLCSYLAYLSPLFT